MTARMTFPLMSDGGARGGRPRRFAGAARGSYPGRIWRRASSSSPRLVYGTILPLREALAQIGKHGSVRERGLDLLAAHVAGLDRGIASSRVPPSSLRSDGAQPRGTVCLRPRGAGAFGFRLPNRRVSAAAKTASPSRQGRLLRAHVLSLSLREWGGCWPIGGGSDVGRRRVLRGRADPIAGSLMREETREAKEGPSPARSSSVSSRALDCLA